MTNVNRQKELLSRASTSNHPNTEADPFPDRSELSARAAEFDHCNMAKVIERLPAQIEIALEQELPPIPKGPFNGVVIAGMGGSALPMDVLVDAFAEQLKVPVRIWRHYDLPDSLVEGKLVVASSFSGGTEEVLAAVSRFPKHAGNAVVLCSGGRLAALGHERGYPIIRIPVENEPEGFQPRSAVGYMVTFLSRVLSQAGVMDDTRADLEAVVPFLRQVDTRTEAESVAFWLKDRIPVVYTDETHLMSIARITKIKFNENSKRPALFNALPEANHNEMIGFSKALGEFGLLYLHDPGSHPRIRHRFSTMKDVFERQGLDHVRFREWEIPGTTKIQKIFASLAFAEWCSYTLALLDGIDPTPVALVESFKKELETSTRE